MLGQRRESSDVGSHGAEAGLGFSGSFVENRLRILRNGLRRKGGMGDVLATIVMVPIFAAVLIGPAVGSGFLAWYFAHRGDFVFIAAILWGIFILCQLASIQLGQPGTTFDPTQLIRFPLSFPGYAAIRVFFGLISPANAISTFMSLAVAIGVTAAVPSLRPWELQPARSTTCKQITGG